MKIDVLAGVATGALFGFCTLAGAIVTVLYAQAIGAASEWLVAHPDWHTPVILASYPAMTAMFAVLCVVHPLRRPVLAVVNALTFVFVGMVTLIGVMKLIVM